mmetsp:Transcript_51842/g.71183  ORF Transcript_51842/g.71183 Transcript_51842/m.71183 type:complete len:118 (-) Transcript_51842:352-705(-)
MAGWYCDQTLTAEVVKPCPAGTYSDTGASECTACPSDKECPYTNNEPLNCPEGFYVTAGSQVSCEMCPSGTYADLSSNTCETIDPGYGSMLTHLVPMKCTYGYYSDSTTIDAGGIDC